MRSPLWALLVTYSLQELRQHPWRNAVAVLAVALGVALAFSVHLINASALDAFSQALRASTGQPDLVLYRTGSDKHISLHEFALLQQQPEVALALPVLDIRTTAFGDRDPERRVPLQILGVDTLQVARLAPDLLPQVDAGADRLRMLEPDQLFLNGSAAQALGHGGLQLQNGQQLRPAEVAGRIAAPGVPLAVMDIAAAQELFDMPNQLSRAQLRLRDGTDRDQFARTLQARADWPAGLLLATPPDDTGRVDTMSRAYRVNLTVLALMALFTGAFLVFSVLTLSVTRRLQQFALLGVLGLTNRQAQRLVLLEAGVLASLGSLLGIAAGTGLAALALRLLGGDLGGGYFASSSPPLHWSLAAASAFALLGLAAAQAGAWWPARMVLGLPPAQALKGLGLVNATVTPRWSGLLLLAGGGLLALMPPIRGIALAAYCSMALLLLGGIATLPALVSWLLNWLAPRTAHRVLPMLAVERARRTPASAAIAVNGVVAALSLAVAVTVMVSSFRLSVTHWLDQILPASLYVRIAANGQNGELAYFAPGFVTAAARLDGVARLDAQHSRSLTLEADKPAVSLMARPLRDSADSAPRLPLLGTALTAPSGCSAIYVSEAMVDLYGAAVGQPFAALQSAFTADTAGAHACFFVAGVWRDYAHQFGSIAIDLGDLAQLQAAPPITDLALWLTPHADPDRVQAALRTLADQYTGGGKNGGARMLDFGDSSLIRTRTLEIFDRSFAVTYWLQAVAIGIGLFGVATSFSAQVLARRKEFGLLVHLGLTRGQIVQLLATEAALWTALGSAAGVGLGLVVSEVLVHVVNPQSFHWTMDLYIPWLRLGALAGAVVVAGTVTAWLAGRNSSSGDVVRAVRQDW